MNRPFEKAEWIWLADALPPVNVYALFRTRFAAGAAPRLRVAVSGNYAAYINGRLAACIVGTKPNATIVDRYVTPGGRQIFIHPLRRFGARFLEIHAGCHAERLL